MSFLNMDDVVRRSKTETLRQDPSGEMMRWSFSETSGWMSLRVDGVHVVNVQDWSVERRSKVGSRDWLS